MQCGFLNSKDSCLTFNSSACRGTGCLASLKEVINNDMLILTNRLILITKYLATFLPLQHSVCVPKCTTQNCFLWYQAGIHRICCKHSQDPFSDTGTFEIYVCCLIVFKAIFIFLKAPESELFIFHLSHFKFQGPQEQCMCKNIKSIHH